MIQSLYRGYVTRKLYYEYLWKLEEKSKMKNRKGQRELLKSRRPESRQTRETKSLKQA